MFHLYVDMSEFQRNERELEKVIRQSKANDPLVIEQMMNLYYASILRLARSILQNETDASDAAQETFISAAQNLRRFRGESGVKTWLFAIAVNTCRGILRKQRTRTRLQHTLEGLHIVQHKPIENPESKTIEEEADRSLWKAVDSLKEQHRLPIILCYVHELNSAEIAEVLEISEGTVHSRLHYARRYLRETLVASPNWSVFVEHSNE